MLSEVLQWIFLLYHFDNISQKLHSICSGHGLSHDETRFLDSLLKKEDYINNRLNEITNKIKSLNDDDSVWVDVMCKPVNFTTEELNGLDGIFNRNEASQKQEILKTDKSLLVHYHENNIEYDNKLANKVMNLLKTNRKK